MVFGRCQLGGEDCRGKRCERYGCLLYTSSNALTESFNSGSVTGTSDVGGITGAAYSLGVELKDVYKMCIRDSKYKEVYQCGTQVRRSENNKTKHNQEVHHKLRY